MSSKIKCPSCSSEFEPNEAIREEIEKELRAKVSDWQKKKNEEHLAEMQKQEMEWTQKLQAEKVSLEKLLEEKLRKSISGDFENRLNLLQKANNENEERLKQSRIREAEFLKQQQDLKNKEAELELTLQKKLSEEREKLSEQLRKIEAEKSAQKETEYQLKLRELEKQLEDQKKLADEMKRKAEQGSMQLQGESQELALEELLNASFPFDKIEEVAKGMRGADCIQIVRNNLGNECGRIIWESKRAENFGGEWIEKLKTDMRASRADVAILVTRRFPKEMDRFGEKDGVWICTFAEVRAVAAVLRDRIIKVYQAHKKQENRGDKMQMIYDYVTGNEFKEQLKAVVEGFTSMRESINQERIQMEKLWKSREKHLDKILLNATHITGSIEGISGLENSSMYMLDDEEE
ncbi:MAG TPA: DUF2130 domain-containing protein [Niabella sp.]|nr:DUF2130 domain-containing protein [Niabella sp.]HOZ98220.1 DUF2130 domain-containing protein [Niabella sp.]HQW16261.1 DUF2130 domain-containing protein [Niabella sp.]HQX21452.1 DUF2130 domain-containing protein [Niabella sp.]HQX42729.1 DUF2130 domain-containing protein [Niabella sp.]